MILGVLFSRRMIKKIAGGANVSGLQFLAEESINEGIKLIAFSPDDIDWWNKSINALVYTEEGKWTLEISPFPDVIYDRSLFSSREKEIGKISRQRFKNEYKIPFLNNRHYFPKWETHKVLLSCRETRKYLPDTALCTHPATLIKFLNKYGVVYIKDSGGSRGENIYKVYPREDGVLIVSYVKSGKIYMNEMSPKDVYTKIINGSLYGKKVILQQGINLAHFQGKPLDVRILVQKDASGKWIISDKSIRIANSPHSPVTNISNGGEVKKFADVIPKLFPISNIKINEELDKMLLSICNCLEINYGLLGELGIDVALDIHGRLYLLEVNGKPAKSCIRRSNNRQLIHEVYSNIIKYCKYLKENNPISY
ncbi:alpha-L-glutamate ligase [Fervidicella metallireducens AeB]|uniref:Alpha-L-glutamate ligase n=1 Tax=Fervidicella metallireducens AeB TaxID=1403537 RepID=A0A017RXE9_9CLOT|nr:YheC/YheD family protein [Fervidicella metallireducens]EYE89453.1 alpha-L-glutamate ligase [Fervidicella metallireducens AeB]